jgi:hypothetical protein
MLSILTKMLSSEDGIIVLSPIEEVDEEDAASSTSSSSSASAPKIPACRSSVTGRAKICSAMLVLLLILLVVLMWVPVLVLGDTSATNERAFLRSSASTAATTAATQPAGEPHLPPPPLFRSLLEQKRLIANKQIAMLVSYLAMIVVFFLIFLCRLWDILEALLCCVFCCRCHSWMTPLLSNAATCLSDTICCRFSRWWGWCCCCCCCPMLCQAGDFDDDDGHDDEDADEDDVEHGFEMKKEKYDDERKEADDDSSTST